MIVVKQINFTGRLLEPDGSPASGASVGLFLFRLEANEWEQIGDSTADRDGVLKGTIKLAGADGNFLPLISLVGPSRQPLKARIAPTASSGGEVVSIEFGDVVVADDERPTKIVLDQKPIDSVIAGLGGKMADANVALRNTSSGRIRVGDVKVTLRGVVGDDGLGIALNSHAATATAGSTVEVEYKQTEDADVEAVSLARVVPDIRGTTETLARRILISVGLQMSPSTKSAGDSETVGQCVVQSPSPGTEAQLGATVLAVFAA